jgi:hypothetical protein
MGEEQAQLSDQIPDLPSGLAEPESPPSVIWVALRPDLFGLPGWAVAAIYLAEALLLFLIVQAVWRIVSRVKPAPAGPALPPPREEAKAALAQLKQTSRSASARDLALLLSPVVRRFTEREYGIGLTTQTQEEFNALLAQYPDALPQKFAGELRAFLDECDQAKFQPGADQENLKNHLWEQANRLIQEAPRPVPKDEST